MKIFELVEKINLFSQKVQQRHTGAPTEFAETLGVSRSSLYNLIDEFRSRGVDVRFSRRSNTFYYSNGRALGARIDITDLDDLDGSEAEDISGGCNLFSPSFLGGQGMLTFPGFDNASPFLKRYSFY